MLQVWRKVWGGIQKIEGEVDYGGASAKKLIDYFIRPTQEAQT